MGIPLNGNPDTNAEIAANGGTPEYESMWVGPWLQTNSDPQNPTWNMSSVRRHLANVKANNRKAAIQFFFIGDELCHEWVTGQYEPADYNGKPQSLKMFWSLAWNVANEIKAAGVTSLVILETEWNKKGPHNTAGKTSIVASDETCAAWDTLWSNVANAMKRWGAGHVKVCTAPGSWGSRYGDVGDTLAKFPKMIAASDVVGTQCLRSMPRNGADAYDRGPDSLLGALNALAAAAPGKDLMVTDFFFSTYGGNFAKSHPFAGGDGRADEARQQRAFERLLELRPEMERIGVKAIFTRGIVDASGMNVANYHGYAERFQGVIRSDGSRKPAYDALMALSRDAAGPVEVRVDYRLHLPVVEIGGEACGTVTVTASRDTTLKRVGLAARPPGGTRSGGPYLDIGAVTDVALKAGVPRTIAFRRPVVDGTDPTGAWFAYGVVQLADGTWLTSRDQSTFTVLPRCGAS